MKNPYRTPGQFLISLVLGIVVVWVGWYAWRLWLMGGEHEGQPVWAWAEANQGLLSLLALIVALIFALFEMHRANSEAARRLDEYVDVLIAISSDYISDLQDAADNIQRMTTEAIADWDHRRGLKRKTLDILRGSSPQDARLAILQTELDEAFVSPFPEGRIPYSQADTQRTLRATAANIRRIGRDMEARSSRPAGRNSFPV